MDRTLSLVDSIRITSRDHTVTVDLTRLSPAVLCRAVIHGITQRVADGAAGSAGRAALHHFDALGIDAPSKELVKDWTMDKANAPLIGAQADIDLQKVVDVLYTGVWGAERTASTRDPVEDLANKLAYAGLTQFLTNTVGNAKAVTDLNAKNRKALIARFRENSDVNYREQAESQLELQTVDKESGKADAMLAALGLAPESDETDS